MRWCGLAVGLPLAVVLWTAWPCFTDRVLAGNDARDGVAYHAVVADALAQAAAGVFPPYVGQSEWRYNGGTYPQAQAPWLSLIAVATWAASGGQLGSGAVLNAVIVLSLIAAALGSYRTLARLWPGREEAAAVGALAYATCPGLLGTLFRLDMVTTALAAPFLPLAFGAAYELWTEPRLGLALGVAPAPPRSPTRVALRLALWTALVWMAHPPVALWLSTSLALFVGVGVVLRRVSARPLALAALAFLACEAWHLTTVFSLGAHQAAQVGVGTRMAALAPMIVESERHELPGALLPVGWARGGAGPRNLRGNGWPFERDWLAGWPEELNGLIPYIQFGWPLWLLYLAGLVLAVRQRDARVAALALAAGLPLLALFPIPHLSEWFWSHLPSIYSITREWPMQRLYLVAAAPATLFGVAALTRGLARRRAAVLLALVAGLATWESSKFRRLAQRAGEFVFAIDTGNTHLRAHDLQMGPQTKQPFCGDPWLAYRLLDAERQALPIPNPAWDELARRCEAAVQQPVGLAGGGLQGLESFDLSPGARHLLCLRSPVRGAMLLAGDDQGYFRQVRQGQPGLQVRGLSLLPVYAEQPRRIEVRASVDLRAAPDERHAYSRVAYSMEEFALRATALLPRYEASLVNLPERARWFETPRVWLPGYRATLDGQPAVLERSPHGYVMVAVAPAASRLTLGYHGTAGMRAAGWLSLGAFLGCGLFLLRGASARSHAQR